MGSRAAANLTGTGTPKEYAEFLNRFSDALWRRLKELRALVEPENVIDRIWDTVRRRTMLALPGAGPIRLRREIETFSPGC
jgi:hypothetical protein